MSPRDARSSAARSYVSPLHPSSGPHSALYGSLDQLLQGGGDPRLEIAGPDGLNRYGCKLSPRKEVISFASSTATTISERAYLRAARARDALLQEATLTGLRETFAARIEDMRRELKRHLLLGDCGAEIVFSPSGTNSQLHALFVARSLKPGPLTTVIVGSDQTGSGTAQTARGQHFGECTSQGLDVEKGSAISGLADGVESANVGLHDASGALRDADTIDGLVIDAVSNAVAAGRHVLLQIMDSSKLGWRSPGADCLREIRARWPDQVQIVVDACQARLSRTRIRTLLDDGFMVLLTGSKFFTGPPFSGALAVPEKISRAMASLRCGAGGLAAYSTSFDWPERWSAIRVQFSDRPNFGQWLRWEAALEEIRAYYAVPAAFRRLALARFATAIPELIAASPSLEFLPAPPRAPRVDDEEMALPSIFPFLLRKDGVLLSAGACSALYRALNADSSHLLPNAPALAARICHIGQPVPLYRGATAALRVSTSARLVTECWSLDMGTARETLQREIDRVATVFAKIELLIADGAALLTGDGA